MTTTTEQTAHDHAITAIGLITDDVLGGILPGFPTTFAGLHDHVDANDYVAGAYSEGGLDLANEVATLIDGWLVRLAAAAAQPDGRRLPRGWRRGTQDEVACPHRDLSVCPTCATEPEVMDVFGAHYWVRNPVERMISVVTL